MGLIGFLLRYGPKSVAELLSYPTYFLVEISDEIGEIMNREKDQWDRNLMTGDS